LLFFSGSESYTPSTLVPLRITSDSISTALRDAAESVVKKGFPVPAPKITILPFSKCLTAKGFQATGLDNWIGEQLTFISFSSAFIVILLIVAGVNFLTELTSNMATTAMLLPVMIPLATLMGINPYLLLVGTTLAASCAFMLPVATPPNAVVFGSKLLNIADMVKAGILINLFSILLILLMVYFGMPFIWDLTI